jgi:hypothetical protein
VRERRELGVEKYQGLSLSGGSGCPQAFLPLSCLTMEPEENLLRLQIRDLGM